MRKSNFTQVPNWLIQNGSLNASEWRLLIVLLSLNPCYPSHSNLATWTGLSLNTVNRVLRSLKSLGVLSWERGHSHGKNNFYTIHWNALKRPRTTPKNYPQNWVSTTPKTGDPIILMKELNQNEFNSNFEITASDEEVYGRHTEESLVAQKLHDDLCECLNAAEDFDLEAELISARRHWEAELSEKRRSIAFKRVYRGDR